MTGDDAIAARGFLRAVRIAVLIGAAIPRRGCAALIEAADGLELVYEGRPDDRDELAAADADITVVGVLLESEPAARAIQELAASGVCVLAVLGPGISPRTAMELGAHAYVDGRDPDGSALIAAITRLVQGEHDAVPDSSEPVLAIISPREREVLRELARGRTDQEIAVTLGISVRTVQSHLDRIREKTRRRRRADLTVLALELGIVPRDGTP